MPRQGPITERQEQTTAADLVRVRVDRLRPQAARRLQKTNCTQRPWAAAGPHGVYNDRFCRIECVVLYALKLLCSIVQRIAMPQIRVHGQHWV